MREIDKKIENSIKRKKQMRTTTFAIALLVAAIMVISPIPATNVNSSTQMNDNNEQQPLFLEDDVAVAHNSFTGMNLGLSDKAYPYEGSTRAIVVWNNGMSYDDGWTAQTTQCTYDGEPADDFILGATTAVMDVHWPVIYMGGFQDWDWYVRFYTDDGTGNYPGTEVYEQKLHPDTVYIGDFYGYPVYECSVDLPSAMVCNGGQKYWLSLQGDGPCSVTRTFWAMKSYLYNLHVADFRSNYFTGGIWRDSYYMMGAPYEMCFQLTTKMDHDVAPTEIVSPVDNQDLCECLPVVVKVMNIGSNDEVNVPVQVEIFQNAPGYPSSFNEPFPGFWQMNWGLWSVVYGTQYPGPVSPHTGNAMARFDGSSSIYGSDILWSEEVDFTQACSPKMCFWMWHDTYSSDDYIQIYVNGFAYTDPLYRFTCDGPGWYKHCVDLGVYAGQYVTLEFWGYQDGIIGAYDIFIDDVSLYDSLYDETMYVDISAGQEIEIEFPDFCPCQWQTIEHTTLTFTMTVTTQMIGDENPGNDVLTDSALLVYFPYYHDVGGIDITSPEGFNLPEQAFEMCGTIKNFGQYTECCFKTYMSVEEQYTTPGWFEWGQYFTTWPSTYVPPVGWTDEHTTSGWARSYTSYSGGTSPEARLFYSYGQANKHLYSPAFDTIGDPAPKCHFLSYIDHYSGNSYYTLYAGWSLDHITWNTAWTVTPSGNAKYDITFDLPAGQPTVYVGWWFTGNSFYFDNWYLDNVEVYQPDVINYYPAEWTDEYCVESIDVCEELNICFDDWTPAQPWPDCGTKIYRACIWTNMCDPLDENIANDKVCEIFSVDFWHDVAVKEVSSPVGKAQTALDWLYYDDGSCENSLGLTAGGTIHEVIKLTPDELGAYDGYQITQIQVMHGCAMWGEEPTTDYEVWMWTGTSYPSTPADATIVATGTHTGSDWVTIDTDDYPFDTDDTVWIGVGWIDTPAGAYPLGMDESGYVAGKSDWFWYSGGWYEGYQVGFPCNFMIRAGIEPYGGAPTPDVYIPCGEQELCVTVENLGTFQENDCTVYWELWEWVTDPNIPTLAASGSVDDVDLAPFATAEVCLGTYDFTEPGLYELVAWIVPLGVDCDWENNLLAWGIGVDCCPPETEYQLTPATPNGQNNWYVSDVTVKLTAVDPPCPDPCVNGVVSGIAKIYYKVDGVQGEINGASGTFKITTDGNHLVEYWAVDNVGNEEVHQHFTVAIDKTKPTVELVFEAYQDDSGNWKVDFTALAADATSGVNKVEIKKDTTLLTTITGAGPYKYTYTWTEGDGTKTFYAYVYDNAGNSNSDSVVVGPLSKSLSIEGKELAKTLPKILVNSK